MSNPRYHGLSAEDSKSRASAVGKFWHGTCQLELTLASGEEDIDDTKE